MTSDAVRDLEKLFLPRLEKFKKECSDALPKLKFIVWSSSIGGQTDYQGHNLGIECLFPEATDEQADTVAIIVGIKHLTTTPLLCDASVEWGHGWHPEVAIDLLPEPVLYTSETLNSIFLQFEKLQDVFLAAVNAGPQPVVA